MWVRVLLVCCCLLASARVTMAQSQVRVNADQTTIWRPGFSIAAEVVSAGTTLKVVARSGTWYEVELPTQRGQTVQTGFVAASRVTALDQSPIPERPLARASASQPRASNPSRPRPYQVRVFVQSGFGPFTAKKTFDALFDSASGFWWGGGIQTRTRSGWLVDVAAERFERHGTRVFVLDGDVFDLGVEDRVKIVPVTFSVGHRLWQGGRRSVYAAAGAGRVFYRETSPGASEDENVDTGFPTYQARAGVELLNWSAAALAVEGQYSRTPISGDRGIARVFGERDLGGAQVRVKLSFGR